MTDDRDFSACTAFTRVEEGGYVDDPRDSGNWSSGVVGTGRLIGSNMGVGAPALTAWLGDAQATALTMRTLAPATYAAIARARYWDPLACALMPRGVQLMVFDYSWNRGVQSGIRLLQRTLNIIDDGVCGMQTIRAAQSHQGIALIDLLAETQAAEYRSLRNFNIYGHGWIARTARRRAAAIRHMEMPNIAAPDGQTSNSLIRAAAAVSTGAARGKPAGRCAPKV